MPAPIDAGEARTIALQFADRLRRDTGIKLVPTEVLDLEELKRDFGLTIDCRGGKEERTCCGEFEGEPFWGDDPRERVLEAALAGSRPRVLISGGGDGAIQDFLLLATGESSILKLAQQAGLSGSPAPGSRLELAEFERQALSMEERCWREYCWRGAKDTITEQEICEKLERFYSGWVERLDGFLQPLPQWAANCEFTLVRKSEYHSTCYPLNRLLAIIAERQFNPRVLPGDLTQMTLTRADFDVCIIRHGIGGEPGGEVVRSQALPYRLHSTD